MSSHLGVGPTLELLSQLRSIVRDFADREHRLNQDLRVQLATERRRGDTATEQHRARLAEEVSALKAVGQARQASLEAFHQARLTRLSRAARTSRKQRLEEAEIRVGRRKYELQKELIQAERNRAAQIAAAHAAGDEFQARLVAEQEQILALENDAQKSFRGYASFRRWLAHPQEPPATDLSRSEHELFEELRALLDQTSSDLARFRRFLLPRFFRLLPLWIGLVFAQLPAVAVLQILGKTSFTYRDAVLSVVGCLVFGFVLHLIGRRQAAPLAKTIASAFAKAHRLHDACLGGSQARRAQELERVAAEFKGWTEAIDRGWGLTVDEAGRWQIVCPQHVEEKAARISDQNARLHRLRMERCARDHAAAVARLETETAANIQAVADAVAATEAKFKAAQLALWQPLAAQWTAQIQPLYQKITNAIAEAGKQFPPWEPARWEKWTPPAQFPHAAPFAHLDIDVDKLAEGAPKDPRLALPGPGQFSLPLLLTHPDYGSLLLETTDAGRDDAIAALNSLILRLLTTAPAGRLSFSIYDPVGLGQSFSGVMHLADAAEHLINGRIWTQPGQIDQRLADLNEHMEKVIQMYLRNEYATIAEYNEQAGNIAEKYHFLVVADFPAGFSDVAARRLMSIATSGARCGVFTLIHWNRRQLLPQDFVPNEFRKGSVCVTRQGNAFTLTGQPLTGTLLLLDAPPEPEFAIELIQEIGRASRDSNRVEVPFAQITPSDAELWSLITTSELRVPIGRTGATKFQYLALGKGTRQHALVAGKTGSGKSTLFHVLITNLALWSSPEQVEFYLIDFKKGVEFKCYASHRLPHARVVAIESDREFGLSVLQRLDEELKRRGDLFRALGVQDLPGYQRAGGTEALPRSLLIIDEFQEFFVEDDTIAQTASLLLDRIVRQGRAFGIHVLLGSQTLGGAYTVARATLGQMVIRIALQCNEADAYLIMDDSNPAPRLLSRPGEGIYNDSAGAIEGNSPFQVVWLPDEVRDDALDRIQARAQASGKAYPGPIVFEGNAPSDVRENPLLARLLQTPPVKPPAAARLWLGAPNAIKGPTEAVFHRQGGNHLLLVGQRDEAILAILSVGLIALAAQYPAGTVRFVVCDGSAPETPQRAYLERVIAALPHPAALTRPGDLAEAMQQLAADLGRRTGDEPLAEAPTTFLFIHGLQKFSKLRHEEDFSFSSSDSAAAPSPSAAFNTLITEGARLGFHVIATCDSYNNVNRFLSRKMLGEFELRVLFQMSANDSATLIDNPKASTLGLHRALFYNEHEGYLETFRPYALPPGEWIAEAARSLRASGTLPSPAPVEKDAP